MCCCVGGKSAPGLISPLWVGSSSSRVTGLEPTAVGKLKSKGGVWNTILENSSHAVVNLMSIR